MAKKKPPEKQISVALLDDKNVYQGVELIAESQLTTEHVQVPVECDLPFGKYAWNAERQTFLPTATFLRDQLKARNVKKRGH